jgi:hypothetical protein
MPIPYEPGATNYYPLSGKSAENPDGNAFNFLAVSGTTTPYDWYFSLCSSIGQPGAIGVPPWENVTTEQTLAEYLPADASGAELLTYFYTAKTYGTPVFGYTWSSVWTTANSAALIEPMCVVWKSSAGVYTAMIYHANNAPITVTITWPSKGTSILPNIEGFTLACIPITSS